MYMGRPGQFMGGQFTEVPKGKSYGTYSPLAGLHAGSEERAKSNEDLL